MKYDGTNIAAARFPGELFELLLCETKLSIIPAPCTGYSGSLTRYPRGAECILAVQAVHSDRTKSSRSYVDATEEIPGE